MSTLWLGTMQCSTKNISSISILLVAEILTIDIINSQSKWIEIYYIHATSLLFYFIIDQLAHFRRTEVRFALNKFSSKYCKNGWIYAKSGVLTVLRRI